MEEDPDILAIMLLRMRNDRDSPSHRLPPETLAAVAFHLDCDKSLIAATHVCHFWRSTLIASPPLWSHITFDRNELRAFEFLERSKSAGVSVDLTGDSKPSVTVKESLMRVSDRLTSLRAVNVPFLDELLIQPLPILRDLEVSTSGKSFSVPPPAATSLGRPLFHVPHLTKLRLVIRDSLDAPRMGDNLIDFLRNCPLLEVAFFGYGNSDVDIKFTTDEGSTDAVSLPRLRSFAHESPVEKIHAGLFNRLSLPPTCNVAFGITDLSVQKPWNDAFPALRDPPYLSDVKHVRIACHAPGFGHRTIRASFSNSRNTQISFCRSAASPYPTYLTWWIESFLKFLGSSEMARSIETLCFNDCEVMLPHGFTPEGLTEPLLRLCNLKTILLLGKCNPAFFLVNPSPPAAWCPGVQNLVVHQELPKPSEPTEWNCLERVRDIAVSRREYATPLKVVALSLPLQEAQIPLQTYRTLIGELDGCVELVQLPNRAFEGGVPD